MFGVIWSALFSALDDDVVDVLLVAAVAVVLMMVVALEVAAIGFFFGVTTQFCAFSSEAVAEIVTIFLSVLLSPSSTVFFARSWPSSYEFYAKKKLKKRNKGAKAKIIISWCKAFSLFFLACFLLSPNNLLRVLPLHFLSISLYRSLALIYL